MPCPVPVILAMFDVVLLGFCRSWCVGAWLLPRDPWKIMRVDDGVGMRVRRASTAPPASCNTCWDRSFCGLVTCEPAHECLRLP